MLIKFFKLYLLILFFFGWGYLSATFGFFPFNLIDEPLRKFSEFATYEDAADTNLVEKVLNDLGLSDARHVAREAEKEGDRGRKYKKLALPGSKSSELLVFTTESTPPGYYFIQGSFNFDESMHGIVLLNGKGELINAWGISQEGEGLEIRDTNTYPHGLVVLKDGSLFSGFDNGNMAVKYDRCGERQLAIPGNINHSLALLNQNYVWGILQTELSFSLLKIDTSTGEVVRRIPVNDIIQANPEIDIFGVYDGISPARMERAEVLGGAVHPNDAEPLTEELAGFFERFNAGDLLVSYRNPNLVFVLDPETLRVKWWRQGLVRKQHDPDYSVIDGKGYISVFDNNSYRGPSRIQLIDPMDYSASILLDGSRIGFHSQTRGKHQVVDGRFVIVTASNQGKALMVALETGEIILKIVNKRPKKSKRVISEMLYLPPDYFDPDVDFTCGQD